MRTRSSQRKQNSTTAPSSAPSSPQKQHPVQLDDFVAEKSPKSPIIHEVPSGKKSKRESTSKSRVKNQKENVENANAAEQRSVSKRSGRTRKQVLKDNEATLVETTAKNSGKRAKKGGTVSKSSKKRRMNKSFDDPDDVKAVPFKDLFSKI